MNKAKDAERTVGHFNTQQKEHKEHKKTLNIKYTGNMKEKQS